MPGQISAIHTGDVLGFEGLQANGVVPVVEMAAVQLHLSQSLKRRFEPLYGFFGADPAQVACAQIRQQAQANIRWRGSVGHHRLRVFLKIVRRQPMIHIGQEFLEEAPGTPGNGPQRVKMIHGDGFNVLRRRRQTDPTRDRRSSNPQQRKWNCRLQCVRAHQPNRGGRRQRQHHAPGHALVDPGELKIHGVAGLRGSHPLQHAPMGDKHAHQRAHNRVTHQPGLIRHKSQRQPDLRNSQ